MWEAIEVHCTTKAKPFLGICVGMQLMATRGLEHGVTEGLNWIAGEVSHITPSDPSLKIPHMGWSPVRQVVAHPLSSGIADDSRFYFVHSYRVVPEDVSLIAATTDYGVRFTAAIARDNLFATQFHPEKSADVGLQLLENFVNWTL